MNAKHIEGIVELSVPFSRSQIMWQIAWLRLLLLPPSSQNIPLVNAWESRNVDLKIKGPSFHMFRIHMCKGIYQGPKIWVCPSGMPPPVPLPCTVVASFGLHHWDTPHFSLCVYADADEPISYVQPSTKSASGPFGDCTEKVKWHDHRKLNNCSSITLALSKVKNILKNLGRAYM